MRRSQQWNVWATGFFVIAVEWGRPSLLDSLQITVILYTLSIFRWCDTQQDLYLFDQPEAKPREVVFWTGQLTEKQTEIAKRILCHSEKTSSYLGCNRCRENRDALSYFSGNFKAGGRVAICTPRVDVCNELFYAIVMFSRRKSRCSMGIQQRLIPLLLLLSVRFISYTVLSVLWFNSDRWDRCVSL